MKRAASSVRWLLGIVAVLGFVAPAAQAQESPPFEITQEVLQRILEQALPVARKELGVALAKLRIASASTQEIEDALTTENTGILGHLYPDPAEAAAKARSFARSLAPALLAKYALLDDAILIRGEGIERIALLVGMPELDSEEGLRGLVAHEIVHAADHERFDLLRLLSAATTADALQVRNSVVEGHAQFAGRRLAETLHWTQGFEAYTRAISASPKRSDGGLGNGMEHLKDLRIALVSQSYLEGEGFLAALARTGGAEAVERAFRSPPEDSLCLAHPDWFLHPELRPAVVFDLATTMDELRTEFPAATWHVSQETITPPMFQKAMAPLTAEELAPLIADMRQNLVLMALPPGKANEQVTLALIEFASPAGADAYLRLYQVMQRRRDEQMKEGAVRIVAADYETLEPPDPPGFFLEKRIVVGLQQIEARGLCLVRGPLAAEMVVVSRADWDEVRMLDFAVRGLTGAFGHLAPAREPAAEAR